MNRREFCRTLSISLGGSAAALAPIGIPGLGAVLAQERRTLDLQMLGFVLGIHVPATAAFMEILPSMPGYAPPKVSRLNQIRLVTQTMVGGSADIGNSDPPTVLAAVEAGAKLKIVGKGYDKTSLVLVVNGDRIKTFADLAKPTTRVAIGARGEITHVMLVEPLLKRKIEFDKMGIIEMPGSGARVAGMLSGRIDAGNLHFDQVASIAKQGNFTTLIEPWKEFQSWVNEVWVVRSDWLAKPENERALVDFLKANILAFRRANTDFDWYLERYRRYATIKDAKNESAATLRPIWERLRTEIGAWPNNMSFSVKEIQDLMPSYKAADAIRGTVKVEDVVEPKYVQQALKELG